jgi:hypothetical protein
MTIPLSCPPDATDGYPLGRPTPQHIELTAVLGLR